ncbi:hypothetical protein SAMN05192545_2897 [Maribacter dokdonensis]|uniref:Uncharacterized protein n=1 Tax=Maribacter dokdonensis TaxID=320912 RepID=A0ABY0UTF9_9FLAO|nr:hypothetical protein [Maribacter dokdonensis]SDT15685.1 hypothetical protein SAMN05192545_2897 [Maribacter dokdonensis]
MRILLSIVLLFFISFGFAQSGTPLYKGLMYKMKISDAKKEYRKNKEDYKVISLGNGVDWYMYPLNFSANADNQLVGLTLNSGSLYGNEPETVAAYLSQSFEFFIDKNYTIVHEPDYWDNPLLFDATNKYGLLMHDPDKTIMVSMRAVRHNTEVYNFVPVLAISNYEAFINYMSSESEKVNQIRGKTGF